jgi:hypothetical protein
MIDRSIDRTQDLYRLKSGQKGAGAKICLFRAAENVEPSLLGITDLLEEVYIQQKFR